MSQIEKLKDLQIRVRTARHVVLEYDHNKGDLTAWYWPVNQAGQRVTPSELEAHRHSHDMLGPCCMCPLLRQCVDNFSEAAIFLVTKGRHFGEYVAACATNECGYLVLIENVHGARGVPVRFYPRRGVCDLPPLPVVTVLDMGEPMQKRRKRKGASEIDARAIQRFPAAQQAATVFRSLLRLDSSYEPGLPLHEFMAIFAVCDKCNKAMTKRVVFRHLCVLAETEKAQIDYIDLTSDAE